ncbi:MAG: hypothetical protein AVDCRST_MAG88-797, partial [uncultured Thermomicrobiales bacterium]
DGVCAGPAGRARRGGVAPRHARSRGSAPRAVGAGPGAVCGGPGLLARLGSALPESALRGACAAGRLAHPRRDPPRPPRPRLCRGGRRPRRGASRGAVEDPERL